MSRYLIATQTFPPEPGGMQALMGGLAGALAAAGHGVEVLADRNRSGEPEAEMGRVVLRRFGGPRPWRRRRKRAALAGLLAGGAVDGIVADSWKSVEAIPPTAVPILVLVHGTELPPDADIAKRRRIAAAFGRVRAIAANSSYTAGLAGPYAPAERIAVVNPPILPPVEPGEAETARIAALLACRGPVIATLCRLEPRKGVDAVIRCLPALADEVPGLVHLVAGSGADRERLEALARELGVADRVVFAGRVSEGEKTALFRAATLFAMPGRREGASVEGFGIAFAEAAWHGLPAIAGREGGAADAVLDGETGLLRDPDDTEELTVALRALLADGALRRGMGARAADRARRLFTWDHALPAYLGLLRG